MESPDRTGSVPRILFVSPCRPYPKAPLAKDPVDFFYYRNTLGQRLFQMRSFQSWYSLHFLAQNLPVPSVVLENPTMRRFQEEVERGNYAVVAVGFTVITAANVLHMVDWVKHAHPEIDVILGGYGTAVFKDPDEAAAMLKARADAICFGEGVAFMREYLRKRWGVAENLLDDTGPLRQDFVPIRHCFYRTPFPLFRQIVVLGSLGCPFGCPFCATSSQFDRRRVLVASGRDLFDVLLAQARKHPDAQSAMIYDEDFLIDRPRVLEFMRLMEECAELHDRPMLLTVFASVRTVSMYSMRELLRCGIGTIFVGVEAFQPEVLRRESMTKRDGDVAKLFEDLHSHGINTLGSLILGWDGQTAEQMRAESARFVALNPTFYQVVPLHPVPGTPLWKKLKEQNRMVEGYRFEEDSIERFTFELRDATREEGLGAVLRTYRDLVVEGGPWPFRFCENLLRGYRQLSCSADPVVHSRAQAYRTMLAKLIPLAMVSRLFFHGGGYARRWRCAMGLSLQDHPLLFLISAPVALLLFPILAVLWGGASVVFWLRPLGDQPACLREEYPQGNGADTGGVVFNARAGRWWGTFVGAEDTRLISSQ